MAMSRSIDTMTVRVAIYGHCSVRAYTPERIEQPTLRTLLAAAVRAPTAMQSEPWQFVIVQDVELLKRLSDRAKELSAIETVQLHPDERSLDIFTQPDFNIFYDAGTLVVICAKTLRI